MTAVTVDGRQILAFTNQGEAEAAAMVCERIGHVTETSHCDEDTAKAINRRHVSRDPRLSSRVTLSEHIDGTQGLIEHF